MIRNERAFSSALTYGLVVVITVSLTAGLVIGAETLVNDQRQRAVQSQLDVVAERLASTVMTVDRMGELDGTTTAAITREFPRRVAGDQYRIQVVQEGSADRGTVYVAARDVDVNVSAPVRLSGATVSETRINGGPVRVVYDPSSDAVGVENA